MTHDAAEVSDDHEDGRLKPGIAKMLAARLRHAQEHPEDLVRVSDIDWDELYAEVERDGTARWA